MSGNLFYQYGFSVGALPGVSKLTINTKKTGEPYPARITVMDKINGQVFFIGDTGPGSSIDRYLPKMYGLSARLAVIASDKLGTYNAAVADNVQADLVP